ncbi:MAG: hypothetical protein SGPRY_002996 [Prymnesium sp.]
MSVSRRFETAPCCLASRPAAAAFASLGRHSLPLAPASRHHSPRLAQSSEGEEGEAGGSSEQSALFASLRARQEEVERRQQRLEENWRSGRSEARIALLLDDWIRRLALDWPLAVVGTARGGIAVANLASGGVVARAEAAHPSRTDGQEAEMRLLHGDYDGGGPLAVAIHGNHIVSAGREGGARVWRLRESESDGRQDLVSRGSIPIGALVSSIEIEKESGAMWIGSLDGTLTRWALDGSPDGRPVDHRASLTIDAGASVLCLDVCERLGLVACGTAQGCVEREGKGGSSSLLDDEKRPGLQIFSLADGTPRGKWSPLAFNGSTESRGERCRSVAFIDANGADSIVAGGSDGGMHVWWLNGTHTGGTFDVEHALPGDCLVSGAHDGTLCVWRLFGAGEKPRVLYRLAGYKVWLGSVCTDGQRLVSDGADNALICHDFAFKLD